MKEAKSKNQFQIEKPPILIHCACDLNFYCKSMNVFSVSENK